jgi:hypothetical protein
VNLEKRTRVEIFLPVRSRTEYHAVIEWLAEELAYARGGSTLTTPFTGLYSSIAQGHSRLVEDTIQVLFCDFDLDTDNSDHALELSEYLSNLKELLKEILNQEDVWITCHPVVRVAG